SSGPGGFAREWPMMISRCIFAWVPFEHHIHCVSLWNSWLLNPLIPAPTRLFGFGLPPRLLGLAEPEFDAEGRRGGPAAALPVLDMERLGAGIRPNAPIRIGRRRGLQPQRLHAGLPDGPAIAA